MAEIKVRGFTTRGETKDGGKGPYSRFSLSEGQKQRDGTYKKVWYAVTNFKSAEAPADGSKVEVSGIVKMNEKDGKTYFDILVGDGGIQVLEPPKDRPAAAEPAKDPWE